MVCIRVNGDGNYFEIRIDSFRVSRGLVSLFIWDWVGKRSYTDY